MVDPNVVALQDAFGFGQDVSPNNQALLDSVGWGTPTTEAIVPTAPVIAQPIIAQPAPVAVTPVAPPTAGQVYDKLVGQDLPAQLAAKGLSPEQVISEVNRYKQLNPRPEEGKYQWLDNKLTAFANMVAPDQASMNPIVGSGIDPSLVNIAGIKAQKDLDAFNKEYSDSVSKEYNVENAGYFKRALLALEGGALKTVGATSKGIGQILANDTVTKLTGMNGELLRNFGNAQQAFAEGLRAKDVTNAAELSYDVIDGISSQIVNLAMLLPVGLAGAGVKAVSGVRTAAVVDKALPWANAITASTSEAVGNGADTYDNVLRETGNKDLAEKRAGTQILLDTVITSLADKLLLAEGKDAAKGVKRWLQSAGAEAAQEVSQQALQNQFGYQPQAAGFAQSAFVGGLVGGVSAGTIDANRALAAKYNTPASIAGVKSLFTKTDAPVASTTAQPVTSEQASANAAIITPVVTPTPTVDSAIREVTSAPTAAPVSTMAEAIASQAQALTPVETIQTTPTVASTADLATKLLAMPQLKDGRLDIRDDQFIRQRNNLATEFGLTSEQIKEAARAEIARRQEGLAPRTQEEILSGFNQKENIVQTQTELGRQNSSEPTTVQREVPTASSGYTSGDAGGISDSGQVTNVSRDGNTGLTNQTRGVSPVTTPSVLQNSKVSFGTQKLIFENDLDKALYIVREKTDKKTGETAENSKKHNAAMAYAMEALGTTNSNEIQKVAQASHEKIKRLIQKSAKQPIVRVSPIYKAPKQLFSKSNTTQQVEPAHINQIANDKAVTDLLNGLPSEDAERFGQLNNTDVSAPMMQEAIAASDSLVNSDTASALQAGSMARALESISKDPNATPYNRAVAATLAKLDFGAVRIKTETELVEGRVAQYDPRTQTVSFAPGEIHNISVIQEAVRAATMHVMDRPSPSQKSAVQEVNSIYQLTRQVMAKEGYDFKNANDFIAAVLRDQKVYDLVVNTKRFSKTEPLWNRIRDAIGRLLGLNKLKLKGVNQLDALLIPPITGQGSSFRNTIAEAASQGIVLGENTKNQVVVNSVWVGTQKFFGDKMSLINVVNEGKKQTVSTPVAVQLQPNGPVFEVAPTASYDEAAQALSSARSDTNLLIKPWVNKANDTALRPLEGLAKRFNMTQDTAEKVLQDFQNVGRGASKAAATAKLISDLTVAKNNAQSEINLITRDKPLSGELSKEAKKDLADWTDFKRETIRRIAEETELHASQLALSTGAEAKLEALKKNNVTAFNEFQKMLAPIQDLSDAMNAKLLEKGYGVTLEQLEARKNVNASSYTNGRGFYLPSQIDIEGTSKSIQSDKADLGLVEYGDNPLAKWMGNAAKQFEAAIQNEVNQKLHKAILSANPIDANTGRPLFTVHPAEVVQFNDAGDLVISMDSAYGKSDTVTIHYPGAKVRISSENKALGAALAPFRGIQESDAKRAVWGWASWTTRLFSMTRTSVSGPAFPLSNFTRDIGAAAMYLDPRVPVPVFLKSIGPAMRIAFHAAGTEVKESWKGHNAVIDPQLAEAVQSGQLTPEQYQALTPEQKYAVFQYAGGEITQRAYVGLTETVKDVNDVFASDMRTKIKNGLADPLSTPVGKTLTILANGLENTTRFAVFESYLKAGFSVKDAGVAGKNLTANFENTGEFSRTFGPFFAFTNAKIAGMATFLENIQTNSRTQNFAVYMTALGIIATLVGYATSDKDEDGISQYEKIGSKRDSHFTFTAVGPAVPLPQEMKLFYNLGSAIADSSFHSAGPADAAVGFAKNVIDAVYPLSSPVAGPGNGYMTGASWMAHLVGGATAAQPFIDVATNVNTFGGHIAPTVEDSRSMIGKKLFERYKRSESKTSIALAESLYRDLGYDIEPAKISYLGAYLGGGTSTFLSEMVRSEPKYDGEIVYPVVTAIAKPFLAQPAPYADAARFKKITEDSDQLLYKFDKMDPEDRASFLKNSAKQLQAAQQVKDFNTNEIPALTSGYRNMDDASAKEMGKNINSRKAQITKLYLEANK